MTARPVRVLAAVVVPPHLSVSGAARAAEHLSAAVADLDGFTVDVATMAGAHPEDPEDGGLHHLPVTVSNPLGWTSSFLPNRFRTLFYRSDIPQRARWGDYDVVHIHNPTPALEMWRVARAARRAKVPYVVSTHGFVEIADARKVHGMGRALGAVWWLLVDRPVRLVVRHATEVFVLSPADVPIVEELGGDAARTTVVTNGVALPAVTAADDRAAALARLGVPGDADLGAGRPLRCFFLANHTRNKGLDVLLDAFVRLERPAVLVVGGDKRDLIDYDSYSSRCRPDQRLVFTGRLSDEEVAALFQWTDALVFPTLADTFPLVVLEAMANGTPVVASTVGGIPHQVDEHTGVLVPPGDVDALLAALGQLADTDPATRAAMGRAARDRVEKDFSWASAGAAAAAAYRRIVRR
jgi:starch synthase